MIKELSTCVGLAIVLVICVVMLSYGVYPAPPQYGSDSPTTAPEVEQVPAPEPCGEGAHYAVLEKLNPVLYLRGTHHSLAEVEENANKIRCVREFSKTIKDRCVSMEYSGWLASYEQQNKELRRAIEHPEAKDLDTYEYRERARAKAVAAFTAAHTVPEPPACDLEVIKMVK